MNAFVPELKKTRGKYRSYHTDLKIAEFLGILPYDIRCQIPKSTLYNFRNKDFAEIFGMEFSNLTGDVIALLEEMKKKSLFSKMLRGIIRVKTTLVAIKDIYLKKIKNSEGIIKEKIVKAIEKVRDTLGLERSVRYFDISKGTFYSWSNQIKAKCVDSPVGKCLRIWTGQLTKKEIEKIKELCLDPIYKGWPVASIAYHALRNNILNVSLSTFYKYVNILGINLPTARSRRKKDKEGIRASKPNELWHIDVTVFRTMDNVKAYIYLIIDNFSRYILNWKVSLVSSGKICLENLKEAYMKHIVNKSLDPDKPIGVMMDGGSENNNNIVDTFFNDPNISVQRIIAQQDVIFSNSIIEACNKLVKYRWLYLYDIPDFNSLFRYMEKFIPMYNDIRPHYSLKGLTPLEAYTGKTEIMNKEELTLRFEQARKVRVMENRQHKCAVCPA